MTKKVQNRHMAGVAIYTIRHSDKLVEASSRSGRGLLQFTISQPWRKAVLLFRWAKELGVEVPVLLAPAETIIGVTHSAVLSDLSITGGGKDRKTTVSLSGLSQLRRFYPLERLTLASTGNALSPRFLRAYAIVRTPKWIQ